MNILMQRLMNVVTFCAGCHCLSLKVRLMALFTGWDIAVSVVVTAATFLLGVHARLSLELLRLVVVTVRADSG